MNPPENISSNAASGNSQQTPSTEPAPVPHYLEMHAVIRPQKVAMICGERALTYAQLNERVNRLANAFKSLGVKAGDRVAMMAHNSLESLEVGGAVGKMAAISLPINFRLREHEVAYVLNDSGARVVVVGPEFVQVVERARAEVQREPIYIAVSDDAPDGWLCYEALLATASEASPTSTGSLGSTMSYTSGTTGKPKGAYRPRGIQPNDLLRTIQTFELSETDVHLLAGPYYHSAPGLFTSLHTLLGATVVVLPKFDAVEALRLIDRHHITTTFMAPTLVQRICDVPAEVARNYGTSSLHAIIVGGAPCPYALKVRAAERFGQCLWEFYGATETGIVTVLRPEDQLRKPGSCGTAVQGQEIRLIDAAGNLVPDNTPGEIWVRNSWLAEYFNKPEATASSMRDGFFSVGDIAYRDTEGYYYICDRRVDMIISGGANIYPAEIEAVLSAHPAVSDVAVIGVPDELWGESVKAIVSLHPGSSANADELIAYCGERIADYKKPRSVDFVDELPRSPAGKLLKTVIREPYWAHAQRRI